MNVFISYQVATIPPYDIPSVTVDLGGGGFSHGSFPFSPRRAWTASPTGSRVAVLTTDMAAAEPSYRVHVVDAAGRVVVDRTFPFTPEPIPAAKIDSVIEARIARMDPSHRDEMATKMRGIAPAVYGEAEQIVIGADDRIWVGTRRRAEGTRWLVLSPAGNPVGDIVLPPRVQLSATGAEHIWCIERDELDVESVVRYRLQAGREQP